jgi:hypothetical protein
VIAAAINKILPFIFIFSQDFKSSANVASFIRGYRSNLFFKSGLQLKNKEAPLTSIACRVKKMPRFRGLHPLCCPLTSFRRCDEKCSVANAIRIRIDISYRYCIECLLKENDNPYYYHDICTKPRYMYELLHEC